VPPGFRFCPKVYRGITEQLGAPDMLTHLHHVCENLRAFGPTLGLAFAQFPETFSPYYGSLLVQFLKHWPQDLPLAIEFRHPGWFTPSGLIDDAINLLYRNRVSTVITDTPGRRDVLHLSLTQPKVIVRFQGNELHPTDDERMDLWAERLVAWSKHSLEEIYVFAHQPAEGNIPETARRFRAALARRAPAGVLN
jgi:uncharacterized protein YecE (DUF72 family)